MTVEASSDSARASNNENRNPDDPGTTPADPAGCPAGHAVGTHAGPTPQTEPQNAVAQTESGAGGQPETGEASVDIPGDVDLLACAAIHRTKYAVDAVRFERDPRGPNSALAISTDSRSVSIVPVPAVWPDDQAAFAAPRAILEHSGNPAIGCRLRVLGDGRTLRLDARINDVRAEFTANSVDGKWPPVAGVLPDPKVVGGQDYVPILFNINLLMQVFKAIGAAEPDAAAVLFVHTKNNAPAVLSGDLGIAVVIPKKMDDLAETALQRYSEIYAAMRSNAAGERSTAGGGA